MSGPAIAVASILTDEQAAQRAKSPARPCHYCKASIPNWPWHRCPSCGRSQF